MREKKITIHKKKTGVSANKLLERVPDESYLMEWTSLLAKQLIEDSELRESAVILFRIGAQWLAFEADYLYEIIDERPIHRIPHKVNGVVLGVVNLKGQLRLAVSLKEVLDIEEPKKKPRNPLAYGRMIAITKDGQQWIFPVDEVYGVLHVTDGEIENVPVTIAKSARNYLKGVVNWRDQNVGYLDSELIFSALHRSL